jgi:hypothetical protein
MTPAPCTARAANWLWLTDCEARDRALVVAEPNDGWRAVLSRHFIDVDRVSAATCRSFLEDSPIVDGGGAWLPFLDGSMDCAVLPGVIGTWRAIAGKTPPPQARQRVLREMRRIVSDRGVLVLTGPNRQWYGHVPSTSDLLLTAAVKSAGFRTVRTYLAEPSDIAPHSIVPSSRAAALAFERHEHTQRGRAPRLLATLGLHSMAYPARIVLASS